MKRLLVLFLAVSLHAATYYVSSAGSDSNSGSSASPWLTLAHALGAISCGDTVNIVANGSYVNGNANLPYFPNCGKTTTVQSSALSQFWPAGWRTNPANDAVSYGKLQVSASSTPAGILARAENHGSGAGGSGASYTFCTLSTLVSDVFTFSCSGSGEAGIANGDQVEFEINNEASGSALAIPSQLTILQKYYVINCTGCGGASPAFQVSLTSGGAAITGNTCTGSCVPGAVQATFPLIVTAGSATITSTDAFTAWANGTPIAFSASGFQQFGTLPSPLQANTTYYIVNLSGQTFQVSTTLGGPAITLTTVGTGQLNASNVNLPHDWAFRGLEVTDTSGAGGMYGLLIFGTGNESGVGPGQMTRNIEVDRCWIHDSASDTTPPHQGILDNGQNIWIHDSYIAGIETGEAQAIQGTGSPGPAIIQNNFLESAGEDTLYGGNWPASGTANAYHSFIGNYYYRPPSWKLTVWCSTATCTGAASGTCWYDATDPNHAGGEYYFDSMASQWYQCNSSGMWATIAMGPSTIPNCGSGYMGLAPCPLPKNLAEHKNGRYFTYSGNVLNYSWIGAQAGEAFKDTNEWGSGPGFSNDHIVTVNNAIYNVWTEFTRDSACNDLATLPCVNLPSSHIAANNLFVLSQYACGVAFNFANTCGAGNTNLSDWSGCGIGTGGCVGLVGDIYSHNTTFTPASWPGAYITPHYGNTPTGTCTFPAIINGSEWTNSIISGDFKGDCTSNGGTLAAYYENSAFSHLAVEAGTSSGYSSVGATNTWASAAFPANNTTIAYVSGTGTISGDYHLASMSPYSAQNATPTLLSTDGTDLGADIDLVNMATSGAAAGTPPNNYSLRIIPGSTGVIFKYLAPAASTGACTATFYNAPARISANQVTSVADSGAASVSDVRSRQLVVTAGTLTASTRYYYSLSCGGTFILVGQFQTRVSGTGSVVNAGFSAATSVKACTNVALTTGCTTYSAATSVPVAVAANSVVYWSPVLSGGGTLPPVAEIAP